MSDGRDKELLTSDSRIESVNLTSIQLRTSYPENVADIRLAAVGPIDATLHVRHCVDVEPDIRQSTQGLCISPSLLSTVVTKTSCQYSF